MYQKTIIQLILRDLPFFHYKLIIHIHRGLTIHTKKATVMTFWREVGRIDQCVTIYTANAFQTNFRKIINKPIWIDLNKMCILLVRKINLKLKIQISLRAMCKMYLHFSFFIKTDTGHTDNAIRYSLYLHFSRWTCDSSKLSFPLTIVNTVHSQPQIRRERNQWKHSYALVLSQQMSKCFTAHVLYFSVYILRARVNAYEIWGEKESKTFDTTTVILCMRAYNAEQYSCVCTHSRWREWNGMWEK